MSCFNCTRDLIQSSVIWLFTAIFRNSQVAKCARKCAVSKWRPTHFTSCTHNFEKSPKNELWPLINGKVTSKDSVSEPGGTDDGLVEFIFCWPLHWEGGIITAIIDLQDKGAGYNHAKMKGESKCDRSKCVQIG